MKIFFTILTFCFSIACNSQYLENSSFAMAGMGFNISRQPVMSFGGGYNFNRLYTAANITVTGQRNVPALLEARAGFIIGTGSFVVLYTGLAYEPKLRMGIETSKNEITTLNSRTGECYGMFFSVPSRWDHISIVFGGQMASFGNNEIMSSAFIGLKARLSKGEPCD